MATRTGRTLLRSKEEENLETDFSKGEQDKTLNSADLH